MSKRVKITLGIALAILGLAQIAKDHQPPDTAMSCRISDPICATAVRTGSSYDSIWALDQAARRNGLK